MVLPAPRIRHRVLLLIAGTLILSPVVALAGFAALAATVIALPVRAGLRRLHRPAGAGVLTAGSPSAVLRWQPRSAPVLAVVDGQPNLVAPDAALARAA
jgi:hypothetical protein